MTNFAVSTEPADGLALLSTMVSVDEVQTRFCSLIHVCIHEQVLRQFKKWCTPSIALTLMGQYMAADASSMHEDRSSTATTLITTCIISVSEYENANILCACYFQNIQWINIIFET